MHEEGRGRGRRYVLEAMEPDSSHQAALDQAARWHARLEAPDCTAEEREAFAAWLGSDTNREAWRRAERICALLASAAASDPRLRAMVDQANARRGGPRAERKRAWWVPASLAAGIAAVALVLGFGVADVGDAPLQYASAAARQELTLPDGTNVILDVRTEIDVELGASMREVHLRRGRALFDVAHDAERPFVVSVGSGRVTALGTVFQVHKRSAHDIVVTLAEGAVEVESNVRGRTQRERLAPGDELRMSDDPGAWRKLRVDAKAATSWSDGRHVFRDSPLVEAVEEVNRYATRRVVIADPSLAELTVSGSFVAGDSASIVAAFAAVLPIKIAESGDELLLFRRR